MNGFAGVEVEALTVDDNRLCFPAHQVHLDCGGTGVPARLVGEAFQLEVRAEFTIDAREQVQVESGGNALLIVLGGKKDSAISRQIRADHCGSPRTHVSVQAPKK